MHIDGGYGSEDNDKKLEQLEVTQVTRGGQRQRKRNREKSGKLVNHLMYTLQNALIKSRYLCQPNSAIKLGLKQKSAWFAC